MGPVLAAALHAGHHLPAPLPCHLGLSPDERLREEDIGTDRLVEGFPGRVVVHRSRFQVDLNRTRSRAVYTHPHHAWGLPIRPPPPGSGRVADALALYDRFYTRLEAWLSEALDRHRRVLLVDVHAYCHRRDGPQAPPADPRHNPEVNLGTAHVDWPRFGAVVEAFAHHLGRGTKGGGPPLDIRYNVRFWGGGMARWARERFPHRVCVLPVEFKKTFVDEWSGTFCAPRLQRLGAALDHARRQLEAPGSPLLSPSDPA